MFKPNVGQGYCYALIPNNCNWQAAKIMQCVFKSNQQLDGYVIVSSSDYKILCDALSDIKNEFKQYHSQKVGGWKPQKGGKYWWVTTRYPTDIYSRGVGYKPVHSICGTGNPYSYNSFKTKQDADYMVNKILSILKKHGLV